MGDEKMRRPCFPEETGSTSFIKRVNEVKGDSPEGIGAKRKPLTSEGRKPLSSSVARCRFNHSERAFYFFGILARILGVSQGTSAAIGASSRDCMPVFVLVYPALPSAG
jgi:hypothetical protein